MQKWKVVFLVDNTPGEQIISSVTPDGAVNMLKNQYAGHRVIVRYAEPYHG